MRFSVFQGNCKGVGLIAYQAKLIKLVSLILEEFAIFLKTIMSNPEGSKVDAGMFQCRN